MTVIKNEVKKRKIYNTYIWNLEKWYRRSYLQNRNGYTNIEKKCIDIKGGRVVG